MVGCTLHLASNDDRITPKYRIKVIFHMHICQASFPYYRTHSIEGRFLYKVGTPHNIENDLFNVFFSKL